MKDTEDKKVFHDQEIQKIIKIMTDEKDKNLSLLTNAKTAGGGVGATSKLSWRGIVQNYIKPFYQKISYAIIPFIVFVAVMLFTYYGNQLLYGWRGGVGGSDFPHIPLDDQIPLISWFVYPYFLTFPLGIVTFFYLAYSNKKSFYAMFWTLIICFIISGIIYLCWQTYFTKPDFVPKTLTDRFVVRTWNSTYPINCFPSQHAFMAIGILIGCLTGGKKMKWWFKVFSILSSIMILLATFFIKQHFFVDWIASLGILLVVYAVVLICFILKKKIKEKRAISDKKIKNI